MGDESFVPVSAWLAALLSGSRSELERRGLHVHQELEDSFVIADAVDARKAFTSLMRFVLSSVPDGCEIYLAASREVAPVSRLGAGQFTVRWQVTDLEDRLRSAGEGRVLPLRREPGESRNRVQSEAIRSIRAGFDAAGWDFSLDEVGGGKELLARVSRR